MEKREKDCVTQVKEAGNSWSDITGEEKCLKQEGLEGQGERGAKVMDEIGEGETKHVTSFALNRPKCPLKAKRIC